MVYKVQMPERVHKQLAFVLQRVIITSCGVDWLSYNRASQELEQNTSMVFFRDL